MTETRKLAAILVADVVGYSRLAGADEDRTLARLRALRSDLIDPDDLRAPWPHRQAHRRRQRHRVPQRGRRGALRGRSAARHGRAQYRGRARKAHRISHRHSFGRRGRGERRRSDGRRRQYRRAAGGCSPSRARSVSPRTPTARSRAGSTWRLPISARPNSRTSPIRSGFIRFAWASLRKQSPRWGAPSQRHKRSRPRRKSPPR